jgi:Uma2 family endonuclease
MESGAQKHSEPMSVDEWFALPEDEPGELVDGVLAEEEAPDATHELIVAWIVRLLGNWMHGRGGVVLGSGTKLKLSERRGRMPDASAYLPGGAKPPARGPVPVPPDIAIEIVSPTPRDMRRDRIEKMSDYAEFKIRFYWLIDPVARLLELYELEDCGLYRRALGASIGKVESVPGCPGLALDLDELWSELDALE